LHRRLLLAADGRPLTIEVERIAEAGDGGHVRAVV
jgi:hypothetical protein